MRSLHALHAARDGPPSRVASVVVVGAMGSGTVHTGREPRALGLDVTHERFDGRDGAVGYAHALLYLDPLDDKERDPLCLNNLKRAWHPQLLCVDARGECGEERDHRGAAPGGAMKRIGQCWRKACPAAARRWRGCGAKGTCPIQLAPKPVVLVRHPLRTVESLVAGFCGDGALAANGTRSVEPQILAMARIVGLEEAPLAQISCAHGFARAWAAYYGALELLIKKGAAAGVVRVEQDDGVCAIVSKAAAAARGGSRLQQRPARRRGPRAPDGARGCVGGNARHHCRAAGQRRHRRRGRSTTARTGAAPVLRADVPLGVRRRDAARHLHAVAPRQTARRARRAPSAPSRASANFTSSGPARSSTASRRVPNILEPRAPTPSRWRLDPNAR